MYELERLVEGVPFEVLNQERDSVGIGPCFATVVAGSEPVGVISLIDKGAVGFSKFFDSRRQGGTKLVKALDYLVAINDNSDNPAQKWFINESILASLTGCFRRS